MFDLHYETNGIAALAAHFSEVEQYIAEELLLKSDKYYVNESMIRISVISLSVFAKTLQ